MQRAEVANAILTTHSKLKEALGRTRLEANAAYHDLYEGAYQAIYKPDCGVDWITDQGSLYFSTASVLFQHLEPSVLPRMEERPTSPAGPNLSVLSATSLSHPEMVGLTTNSEVRHTESGVCVSILYARVHMVPVSSDVMLGRTVGPGTQQL